MALRQKKRSSRILIISLTIFCLALIGVGVLLYLRFPAASYTIKTVYQVEGLDPTAKAGPLPGAPSVERPVGENLFSYRINASPLFSADGKGGNIMVQNPSFNQHLMVLEIAIGDELLYQSQYIAPNQYIDIIDLQTKLAPDVYKATAYLFAIDPKSLESVGTFECPLTITVQ